MGKALPSLLAASYHNIRIRRTELLNSLCYNPRKLPWVQGNVNCVPEREQQLCGSSSVLASFMSLVFSHNGPVITSLQSAIESGGRGRQAARSIVQDETPDTR